MPGLSYIPVSGIYEAGSGLNEFGLVVTLHPPHHRHPYFNIDIPIKLYRELTSIFENELVI